MHPEEPADGRSSGLAALSASGLEAAPGLLGARLSSTIDGRLVTARITEVEAYAGQRDPASHAFRGPTARNRVMFGPAGFLYVYFIYGMHWCMNVVCGPEGEATAVLLRAGEIVAGEDAARERRPAVRRFADLARGPARLASCLGVTAALNGADLLDRRSPIRLQLPDSPIVEARSGPRVGVSAAADEPWRFWLADHPTVSPYRRARRAAAPAAPRIGPATKIPPASG